MNAVLLIILLVLGNIAHGESAEPTQPIAQPIDQPISVFASLPIDDYQLSPNGKKIGYFVPVEGRRVLVVHNLDGSEHVLVPPWTDKIELTRFFWKSNTHVIFESLMTLKRFNFRTKTTETRVFSYDLNESKIHWLGRPKRSEIKRGEISQIERIVSQLESDPQHILLELDLNLDGYPDVFKVNIETNSRKRVRSQRSGVNDWFADAKGNIRLGMGYKSRGSNRNYSFKTTDGEWIDVRHLLHKRFDFLELATGNRIYVSEINQYGTESLRLLDVLTEESETLFESPTVDIDRISRHPETGEVSGVVFTDDFQRTRYFDDDLDIVQRSLANAFPDQIVEIADKAQGESLYLINVKDDTHPGTYFLYERDSREVHFVADTRSKISAELSAPTKRVDIPVTDGSTIPAYLTLPRETDGNMLPTILLPHGGPRARDTAHWDYWAQFYASRGYAVLKPNFRGSSGYGPAFAKRGDKQWGGLMQQDLTDATHWLIKEKVADPKRICIVGASYGGYAAMMGLVQNPGLYKCGVSVNGVLDLPRLLNSDKFFIGGRDWTRRMGLAGAKPKQVSPIHQAAEIQDPVLVIASTNDARIPYQQTKSFHQKLRREKKDTTYVELDTGTHYMLNAESRQGVLEATAKFLDKHLN